MIYSSQTIGYQLGCNLIDHNKQNIPLNQKENVTKYDLTELPRLAAYVEHESGLAIPSQAPVVGSSAFTHRAGIHTSAVT